MSTRLTRNSSAQIKRNNEKNMGKKDTVVPKETNSPTAFCDQSVIASKKKSFPCQYCAKVFPKKISSLNHMKKCPKKNTTTITDGTNIGKNFRNNNTDCNFDDNSTIDNNQYFEVLSDSGSSKESDGFSEILNPKIKISQNITVKAPSVDISPENNKPSDPMDIFTNGNETPNVKADISSLPIENRASGNISMYDCNEDISGMTYSEVKRCVEDRKCKHCHKFFENPLDLLRHSRIYHNFPKKILPLEEVEKYFNYPNRSFCPICERPIKTRNNKSIFVKHLLVHTIGLAHECSICKKRFRRRDHMLVHKKRHIVIG